jgi:isoquinoline 1-oxidoreductase beta subunit
MITLSINGRTHTLKIDPDTPLLLALREHLRLTGTKYSCGIGVCGACTVLLDGKPSRSCVTPVQNAVGKEITTIEGIPAQHPVQQAWVRAQVPQCGYCQPGFIMQTIGLLQQNPDASLPDLVKGLNHNLCRCGTYPRIKQALQHLLSPAAAPPAYPSAPLFFPAEPRLGKGLGLIVVPADKGFSLAAVAQRLTALDPAVWFWLTPDNLVTLVISKSEMGQGVYTSLPMILAEELDLPWDLLRVEAAPAAAGYQDPVWGMQSTGGSTSISHLHDVFRQIGAAARQMLLAAAAREWGVAMESCLIRQGFIQHPPSGRQGRYGDFCSQAAGLPVPPTPKLKAAADFTYLGQSLPRPDLVLKVNGTAAFGLDHFTSPLLYAVCARPPAFGAQILAADTRAAENHPGVRQVIRMDQTLAVCAGSLETAWQGRDLLQISWSPGSQPDLSNAGLEKLFLTSLNQPGRIARQNGDVQHTLLASPHRHEAHYFLPYLAHATMEPMNCLADVRPESCEIWVPVQNQTKALETAQELTGLPPEKILIHTTFLGGGFGRRLETDYVAEAVRLSRDSGQPIKLVWTREEDFRYDFFRPMTATRIRAGLDHQGRVQAWDHTIAAPAVFARTFPQFISHGIDPAAVEGVRNLEYLIPHLRVAYVRVDTPIPTGFWRSVGSSHNAFTVESCLDELAHLAGQDPLEFRLTHLPPSSRAGRVLTVAAEKAGWGKPLPPGHALGLAQHFSFGTYVAQVAEVSADDKSGKIRVHRVVCAVDCGAVVNPDTVAAQMEGGIIFGLSAALHEQVHFDKGGVKTGNFSDYPLLTIQEAPDIKVHIVTSGDPLGGIGEPGVPPIAPAVANALFAATGRRVRQLPFYQQRGIAK